MRVATQMMNAPRSVARGRGQLADIGLILGLVAQRAACQHIDGELENERATVGAAGSPSCPCITTTELDARLVDVVPAESNASTLVRPVRFGDTTWQYPARSGGGCQMHDELLPPYCADADGTPLVRAAGWLWAFVHASASHLCESSKYDRARARRSTPQRGAGTGGAGWTQPNAI
eukprot:COSAG02_NODE_17129_length_1026_cov_1.346278_1_plen_176_part_00